MTNRSVDLDSTILSSGGPRPKYGVRTLYLPAGLESQLRVVAAEGSWELGDLARALILAGLAFSLLRLAAHDLATETYLSNAVRELRKLTTGTTKRPYRPGYKGMRSSWITVRLPEGFLKFLTMYARSTGRSRNDALKLFIRAGLLLYLSGYNKFLSAIRVQKESKVTGSERMH